MPFDVKNVGDTELTGYRKKSILVIGDKWKIQAAIDNGGTNGKANG